MSILDGIMKPIPGAPDTISDLARQAGLDPAATEKAVMALAQSHVAAGETIETVMASGNLTAGILGAVASRLEGDAPLRMIATIELAAKRTGLSAQTLETVHTQIGGEASLDAIADGLSMGLRDLGRGDFFRDLLPFG